MNEKAKKDIRFWVEVLKNLGYNFPEELWEVKPADEHIPDSLVATYSGKLDMSYEDMKKLEEKLHESYPDNYPEEDDTSFPTEPCCIADGDKYFQPGLETGLCLWVYIYSKEHYGICMTNCW